ncbi:MAG TPA: GNAT family N-acetyltransferase [Anaerolineales bacterium]|nr:GNAT family N-acetyltransferase [Anaerolineales bacterium]
MPITYRPGTIDDSRVVFEIFHQSLIDLSQRIGAMAITNGNDPAVMASLWETRGPLFEHLARTAEQFWIAEDAEASKAIGYARAILRDGVRELTEFFVLPGHQSGGVGRELLARAFLPDGAKHRVIVATTDSRAQARYLKTGVYPRFPIYYFSRKPEPVSIPTDLTFEPLAESPETFDALRDIDLALFGHRRDVDHAWLMTDRNGFLYRRDGQPVGYGYTGVQRGPFALLDAADIPAALAHAETYAHSLGLAECGFEVPLINKAAVGYLLSRGYHMDTFFAFFMCDKPFGEFENYICPSPPFFF